MKDVVHMMSRSYGGLVRTTAVQTGPEIGRIPIPPIVFSVRLLVTPVPLFCLVKEFCKHSDIDLSGLCGFPFAAGKAGRDLLKQPAVPVWILKRGKREIGTTFRVAPGDARVLHSVV